MNFSFQIQANARFQQTQQPLAFQPEQQPNFFQSPQNNAFQPQEQTPQGFEPQQPVEGIDSPDQIQPNGLPAQNQFQNPFQPSPPAPPQASPQVQNPFRGNNLGVCAVRDQVRCEL